MGNILVCKEPHELSYKFAKELEGLTYGEASRILQDALELLKHGFTLSASDRFLEEFGETEQNLQDGAHSG